MKRKASTLDEPTSFEWPRSDMSTTSTASPDSLRTNHAIWHTPSVPYLNARTRKRHRDGRPDESTVHQHTLAKLFNAQKQMHLNEAEEQRRSQNVDSYLMSLDIPEISVPRQMSIEPRQKSLDSFFGGAQRQQDRSMMPPPMFSRRLTPGIDHVSHCESCASSLGASSAVEAMELDAGGDDCTCIRCSKKVCDMCAVRGNHRICLECAVSGEVM